MGDGRAEGMSAIGDGGQAAISLMPDVDGTHIRIFESSKLEDSYVGDLLSPKSYFIIFEHLVLLMKYLTIREKLKHIKCLIGARNYS